MQPLRQALAEIVAIAEKYDVGLGVTVSNEDCARYLYRLPSWSIVRASVDGPLPASVRLYEGDQVVGAYHVDVDLADGPQDRRIEASVHSLASSVTNMRRYADTINGILSGVLRLLEKQGISVVVRQDAESPTLLNVLPQPRGCPN